MNDDPLIGRQIATYRIERLLGRGGMATVYYGQDVNLKRPAAIKVIDARFQGKSSYAERFLQEAQAVARWRHENIIQVYYADNVDGMYFFAMEYIEGRNLAEILEGYAAEGELAPMGDVLRVGEGIAHALDYAHQHGVIHRDVKPSNVFIERSGRVVLGDFGLALDVQQGSLGETFGSAHYIAPEQARRSNEAGPQSDLYSLGIILYEMLTGALPFDDPSPTSVALQHMTLPPPPPRQINPHLSDMVETVLLKALSKSPAGRYSTGAELIEALRVALFTRASGSMSRPDLPPLPVGLQTPGDAPGRKVSRVSMFQRSSLDRPPAPPVANQAAGSAPLFQAQPAPPPASSSSVFRNVTPSKSSKPGITPLVIGGLVVGCIVLLVIVALLTLWAGPQLFSQRSPGNAPEQPVSALEAQPVPTQEILPAEDVTEISAASVANSTESAPSVAAVPATIKYPDGKRFILYYDENSFYMLQVTGDTTYVTNIAFERLDAQDVPLNQFAGQNWAQYYPTIKPGVCMRLEVIGSSNYLRPKQCNNQYFATRTPTRENEWLFWTKQEGSQFFRVLWKKEELARCEIAAGMCEVFLP